MANCSRFFVYVGMHYMLMFAGRKTFHSMKRKQKSNERTNAVFISKDQFNESLRVCDAVVYELSSKQHTLYQQQLHTRSFFLSLSLLYTLGLFFTPFLYWVNIEVRAKFYISIRNTCTETFKWQITHSVISHTILCVMTEYMNRWDE